MQTDHVKVALMGAWMFGVAALGYVSGVTSLVAWIAVAMLALAPAVVMARVWRVPAPSMSESIREVLR